MVACVSIALIIVLIVKLHPFSVAAGRLWGAGAPAGITLTDTFTPLFVGNGVDGRRRRGPDRARCDYWRAAG